MSFSGVDPSLRDSFLESCESLVYRPYFEPLLDFLLAGGFDRRELVRIVSMIPNKSSPAYKAYTGLGPGSNRRRAERERSQAYIARTTLASIGTFVDMTRPRGWPDGATDVFKFAADLPQGVGLIDFARDNAEPTYKTRAVTILHVIDRLLNAGHRGPLLSLNPDASLVAILGWIARNRLVDWTGRVSPQQDLAPFPFEYHQPAAADHLDVYALLDSAVPFANGEAFGYGELRAHTLIAYRAHPRADCYLQVSRRRQGATRDHLEKSIRSMVARIESMPRDLGAFPLECFYSVTKAKRGDDAAAELPYHHAIRLLLLAHQYPLFAARQAAESVPSLPELANRLGSDDASAAEPEETAR